MQRFLNFEKLIAELEQGREGARIAPWLARGADDEVERFRPLGRPLFCGLDQVAEAG